MLPIVAALDAVSSKDEISSCGTSLPEYFLIVLLVLIDSIMSFLCFSWLTIYELLEGINYAGQ
jgi:hypothetical protein